MQQVKHIPGRGRAYIPASYFWGRTSENSPSETVWKIAEGVSSTLLWRQEAADRDFFDPSWPLRSPDSGSIPNFQTVSKGEFSEVRSAWGCAAHTALCLAGGRPAGARVRMFIVPRQSGRKMYMRERLRKGKAGQERRAQQAARRAEEVWSASSSKMRKAERAPREAVYKAETLKWRMEGGGLSPRRPRSPELGARRRRKPFQTKGLAN